MRCGAAVRSDGDCAAAATYTKHLLKSCEVFLGAATNPSLGKTTTGCGGCYSLRSGGTRGGMMYMAGHRRDYAAGAAAAPMVVATHIHAHTVTICCRAKRSAAHMTSSPDPSGRRTCAQKVRETASAGRWRVTDPALHHVPVKLCRYGGKIVERWLLDLGGVSTAL